MDVLSIRPGLTRFMSTRSTRVTLLVASIIVMSAADLIMTLSYLTNYGMHESNPLARAMMAYGSPLILVAWKTACVGLGGGILWWARKWSAAEIAAWLCFFILCWLMVRWSIYNDYMAVVLHNAEHMHDDPAFVAMIPR